MRRATEELYGSGGRFQRFVTRREAERLEAEGKAERDWLRDDSLRKLKRVYRVSAVEPSKSAETAATLTLEDMRKNAGERGGRVQRVIAETKVRVWPGIGDTRAVRVTPRWA